jgi:hypothetical protein
MNSHSSCEFPIESLTLNFSRWVAIAGSELVGNGLFARMLNVLRSRLVSAYTFILRVLFGRLLIVHEGRCVFFANLCGALRPSATLLVDTRFFRLSNKSEVVERFPLLRQTLHANITI